jgi:hypothetical protein
MACCGASRPKQDYLITYKNGSTERVPAASGIMAVRQKIIAGGGGTFQMAEPLKK